MAKHQFTCPDVIYLRNRSKRNTKLAIGSYVFLFGAMIVGGKYAEYKENQRLVQEPTPDTTE